jgi:hypothetical protein
MKQVKASDIRAEFALGTSDKDMATKFGIGVATVKRYRKELNLSSRGQRSVLIMDEETPNGTTEVAAPTVEPSATAPSNDWMNQ